uniref:Uncharacterized protein n=1 Tax=Triticum urartu TaxID=4572 RepID=A0A8R7R2S8_TRIUA
METSKEARTRKLSSNYGVSSRPTFINNEVIVPGNCFEIFNALGLTHVIILLVNHMILFSSRMFFLHKPYKFYELASLLYAKIRGHHIAINVDGVLEALGQQAMPCPCCR